MAMECTSVGLFGCEKMQHILISEKIGLTIVFHFYKIFSYA